MERHQTHLLGIYSHTNDLAQSKRKLLSSITAPEVPMPLLDEQTTISSKFLLCLAKLASELKRALSTFAPQEEDLCLLQLSAIAQGLKNDRELFTQEEAVIAELKKIAEEWEQLKDPLVRYEQGERQALREKLDNKVKELERWEGMGRSTKKPLYVRKLQRQLRENLERAAQSERAFNSQQQAHYLSARARLLKAAGRLTGAGGRMNRESLVNDTKNSLLRNYIDRFNEGNKMGDRQFDAYRQDYIRTLQQIGRILKQQLYSFSLLLQFSGKLESAAISCYRGILSAEDQFSAQAQQTSEQIFTIVSPRDIIEVVHNCKHFFAFTREWQQTKPKIKKAKEPLEEGVLLIKEAVQRMGRQRDGKEPRKTSFVQQFIQDKKFMETLLKKQTLFEETMLSAWQAFIDGYLRVLQQTPTALGSQGQSRTGKSKLETAFDRLFISYLGETESDRQELSLRHSNTTLISQIDRLIASVPAFTEELDWNGSYACSLGPRLLIHGRVKALPQGLYYESSFNQRNYFFGRTRLFLPKEQIFQINKQTVLLLFPDVLQIVTKYGPVYLHALGKRETMYQNFIDFYLPEVNVQHNEEQIQFNQFKGDGNAIEQRLTPFLNNLQTDMLTMTVRNIDLRTFFHKYWSNTEFSYQGNTHKDFKHYLWLLAEGKNIRCSDFTPGVPYYLLPKNKSPPNTPPQDIVESERLVTYQKKIPSIPFVSKGGDGVCHEKLLFHWGGPKLLVIDLYTTLSGFSMTDSMTVRARQIFKDFDGGVEMIVSAQVDFTNSSPLNPMIRAPALSKLKDFWNLVGDKLTKLQRNRAAAGTGKKLDSGEEREGQEDRIQELELQVVSLKKRMKIMGAAFAVIYIATVLFFVL